MAEVDGETRSADILQGSSTKVNDLNINHKESSNDEEEENNNSIEAVTRNFKDMGNISKSLSQCSKQFENCVENTKSRNGIALQATKEREDPNELEYDSEEFDEYKEEEEFTKKLEKILKSPSKEEMHSVKTKQVRVQSSKSATSIPTPTRTKSRSSVGSTSSSVVRRHPKINMSFTNDRTKQIERENAILLKKILNARSDKTTTPEPPLRVKSCNSSVARKRLEDKIQHDNLIILKKIQRAKSSNLSTRR